MKCVMLSIRPKYCELIASGEKTVEVRKTKPKIDAPFKCYIYCTTDKRLLRKFNKGERIDDEHFFDEHVFVRQNTWIRGHFNPNQKVIGEFVCDMIDDFYCASVPYRKENNLGYEFFVDNGVYKVEGWHEGVVFERSGPRIDTMLKNTDLENMCLSAQELFDYIGIGKHLYGWHISDLVIYDKPKELSEFYVEGDCDCMNCRNCAWFDRGNGYNVEDDCNLAYKGADEHKSYKPIKRPPQSWCYCEELK